MKTEADLQTALRNELEQWFVKQCKNNYADFYLYFTPTTNEHNGKIMICEDKPSPEYSLAMPEKIKKGCTIDQNFNWISHGILTKLPVLSY